MDFWSRVIECYNTEFGEDLEHEVQNDWGDNPIKQSDHFGPDQAYEDWWAWWRDRHWLWATCDAIPGAIGGLSKLRADGHYVEIVTHKPEWARREMTSWLSKWHPQFDRLTLVPNQQSKAGVTRARVLVDDKPQNVQEWNVSQRPAVLFTRPWNEDVYTSPPRMADTYGGRGLTFRADDWTDVLDLIARLDDDAADPALEAVA